MLFRHNNICMGVALGSQYRAMAVAAEILIAQLHSQSKLTTAWHENRKIQYENELLKTKNPLLMCRNVRSIEWHQKTYYKISWHCLFKALYNFLCRGAENNPCKQILKKSVFEYKD
jgi:dTDP-4-amino-4,6-dideoxygalactose transaminase